MKKGAKKYVCKCGKVFWSYNQYWSHVLYHNYSADHYQVN